MNAPQMPTTVILFAMVFAVVVGIVVGLVLAVRSYIRRKRQP